MKSGGNVENNTTTGQNSKKRDFENIRFRKIVKKSNYFFLKYIYKKIPHSMNKKLFPQFYIS